MENPMYISKKISSIVLFLGLVLAGYIGVQYFHPELFADRENRNPNYMKVPADTAIEARDRAKPRFNGEIGGMFLAPPNTPVPEKFMSYEDICGTGETPDREASPDEIGVLALDIDMPDEYVLDAGNINTGAVACGDVVYTARTNYLYRLPNGVDAEVLIGRSLLGYDEVDVAYDRPRVQKIAGRDVIIIEPLTEDGFWQNSRAWFPEPFGDTFISAAHLPKGEFIKLVQLVASSTRTQ